ncbi:potassium channel family protein [Gordonia sp. (in: high G+C Gram-positive bacteria)]|uniref:potassium channel family protein n=1 Tax=Gordonia sp. (in: high G+C Gram-positive bacteria) TaxID=84139 RepID=UPI0039E35D8A
MSDRPGTKEWLAAAFGRPLLAGIVLLVAYFLLPIDHHSRWNTVGFVCGGVLLLVFCVGAVRRIRANVYPTLAAYDVLTALIGLYLVVFSATYFVLSNYEPTSFSQRLTRVDALYYCLSVFTTTGFGDIFANTQPARIAVSAQMVSSLLILGAGVHFVTQFVSERVRAAREPDATTITTAGDAEAD